MIIKVAIITTHPIQYNAPLFQLLTKQKGIGVKVFYTWGNSVMENKFDPGFGREIKWDIPLLDGYEYEFLKNIAKKPGSDHWRGIDNPDIIQKVENFNPTCVLIFGWNFKSHLQCLRHFKGKIPVFFRGDSTLLNEKWGLKTIVRRLYLIWLYKHIDYALYVGGMNKQYFLKHGLNSNQLIYAPHAVDTSRFVEPYKDYIDQASKWKFELGIKPGELTIVYAGKLESVKNPFYLLRLAKELKDLPVKIIIVGNGPLEKKLKQKAGENKQIIFLNFQNQSLMPVVYRLGDVFIMCSVNETWGLGANEAMACGCVLALSNKVGCAPDLINADTGIIFSINEVESCIILIKELIKDRNRLVIMSAAVKKQSEFFSYRNIIEPFINAINLSLTKH